MTTPAGFIPSPLDHATPPQGQALQAAGPVGPTAMGHSPSAAATASPWPCPGSASLAAAAGQASSTAGPAATPLINGTDANTQAAIRALAVQANGRGALLRAVWQCTCVPPAAFPLKGSPSAYCWPLACCHEHTCAGRPNTLLHLGLSLFVFLQNLALPLLPLAEAASSHHPLSWLHQILT